MFKIEKYFELDGYKCVVVGQGMGHRCGYVGIPEGHKYYRKHYDEIDVMVHGGLTYSEFHSKYPIETDEKLWWIGFDCGHAGDGVDLDLVKELMSAEYYEHRKKIEGMFPMDDEIRSTEYVEVELHCLVAQLKEER